MQRDAMQTDNQRLKHVKSDGIESGIQSHYARLAGRDGSPRTRKIETRATQTQLSKKPMTGKERKPANAASHLNQERVFDASEQRQQEFSEHSGPDA